MPRLASSAAGGGFGGVFATAGPWRRACYRPASGRGTPGRRSGRARRPVTSNRPSASVVQVPIRPARSGRVVEVAVPHPGLSLSTRPRPGSRRGRPVLDGADLRAWTVTPATGRPCGSTTRPRIGTSSRTSRSVASSPLSSDPASTQAGRSPGPRPRSWPRARPASRGKGSRSPTCPVRNGTGRRRRSPPPGPLARGHRVVGSS